MEKSQIRDIKLSLASNINLEDSKILERVLAQIEVPDLKPEFMHFDERKLNPYSEEMIRGELKSKLHFGLGIKRKKTIKYGGEIQAGRVGGIVFTFHNSTSQKNIEKIFAWSDDLANTYSPEAGTLTIVPKPTSASRDDMRFRQMFHGCSMGGRHSSEGPRLGMYTWLCKRHVDAIGFDNLKATPLLQVEEKDWGGVKLILGEPPRPWEMDLETWVNTWHTAMDHLRQFHVFTNTVVDGNKIRIYRGKNCETPRPDGKVRDTSCYLAPEDQENT